MVQLALSDAGAGVTATAGVAAGERYWLKLG
jgi:hypothetical protein